jgi:UDP-N-acetylmuramoyl-L-alanyl-D-glutamate--2,6-diaminopimelate ligase
MECRKIKIKKLLKEIPIQDVRGSKEVEITGICANSKLIAPGNLFVAKRGLKDKGSRYIADAVAAGAAAVLTDSYDPFLQGVVQIIHPEVAVIEALIAAHYYQSSDQKLFLVGITGTNGKTTCSFLIRHLLEGLGLPCGLIGTIEWNVGSHSFPATHTTPDVTANHKLFYEMVQNGCLAAAVEVSSHALDQERVRGIEFDVGVFTNVTLDHLDYHLTMERYAASKAKLFSSLGEGSKKVKIAVMNRDSSWMDVMAERCKVPMITYGISEEADLMASDLLLSSKGTRFTVTYQGRSFPFSTPLIGRFNVYNCLAAIGVGLARQESLKKILAIIATFKRVPGRLDPITNKAGITIFVDYAHTDDALRNVLETLHEIKRGRLITLFGCGGDRDRSKRSKMGHAAEEFSDLVIVTSDNPRSEEPEEIIRDILKGVHHPERVVVIVDRREAIEHAIRMAKPGDIVLIAGKGHETYQISSHMTIDFDDRKVATEACSEEFRLRG